MCCKLRIILMLSACVVFVRGMSEADALAQIHEEIAKFEGGVKVKDPEIGCSSDGDCGKGTCVLGYCNAGSEFKNRESCITVSKCVTYKDAMAATSRTKFSEISAVKEITDKETCEKSNICRNASFGNLTELKTAEECNDPLNNIYETPNIWAPEHIWLKPLWKRVEKCKCNRDYYGTHCEQIDGRSFYNEYKNKHGDEAFEIGESILYRVHSYGPKGGQTAPTDWRTPIEVKYTESRARDGVVVFSSDAQGGDNKNTIMNMVSATKGIKSLVEQLQEGDHIEAILLPSVHHGALGRGKICGSCAVVFDFTLVKVRSDLRFPVFAEDVPHLGDSEDITKNVVSFETFQKEKSKSGEGSIVMFYSPTCIYSQKFMPVYTKAAVKYAKDVTFTAVNCIKEKSTCLKNTITGYPTIKFLKGESMTMKFVYERSAAGIDQFISRLKTGKQLKGEETKSEL